MVAVPPRNQGGRAGGHRLNCEAYLRIFSRPPGAPCFLSSLSLPAGLGAGLGGVARAGAGATPPAGAPPPGRCVCVWGGGAGGVTGVCEGGRGVCGEDRLLSMRCSRGGCVCGATS